MATYILGLCAVDSLPSQTLPLVSGPGCFFNHSLLLKREGRRERETERGEEGDMFPNIYKQHLASCKSPPLSAAEVKREERLVAHFPLFSLQYFFPLSGFQARRAVSSALVLFAS